jgi:hypothetical protein
VANRENPLSDPSSSRLILSEEGNLLLFEGSSKVPFWSTNLTFPGSNMTEAVLGDDGNFVLRNRSNASCIFWERFDHPTDTWLPEAKLGIDNITGKPQQLMSWTSSEDPAPGLFSLGLDPNGSNQYFLTRNRSQIYWTSGLWNETTLGFTFVPEISRDSRFIYSFLPNELNGRYIFTYSLHDPFDFRSKIVLNSTGEILLMVWLSGPLEWTLFRSYPSELSDVYASCGAFGVFHKNSSSPCECLKGFKPFSMENTALNDWSGGCVRKSLLECENRTFLEGRDWFLKMSNMRLPVYPKAHSAMSARRCELDCLENCSCTAYAYNRSGYCMIWEGALLNLEQLSYGGPESIGQGIYLRLSAAEHQSLIGEMKYRQIYVIFRYELIILHSLLWLS